MYSTLTGQVGDLSSTLNNLNKQRTAEENRVNSFRTGLLGDTSNYNTQLGQLGIADLNQMNSLERDLNALDSRRNAFSSSILDQLYPSGFSEYNTTRAGLSSGLTDLRNQRKTEEDRISAYETGLLGDVDTYRNTLGGLTIADADKITALQDNIADRQRQAGRFSSALGFDFNDELGELSDVSRGVGNLSRERQTELDRVASEQERILASARSAEQAAESGNIYSSSGLDAIDDRVRDLRADITGFSSLLPSDFTSANSPLTDADTALADLRGRRATELDAIQAGITGATSGLGDLNLYDEDAIRKARSDILNQQGNLAAFTGGRVGDIGASATAGLGQVDTKLAELTTARNDLETRAQTLMDQINNASFYATDDLTSNQSSAEQLQAEVELYKANQAMDEIDTLMNRLNSERGRLERDEEAVAAREARERTDILSTVGSSGVPEFQNYSGTDPLTLQQYLALLNNEEENTTTGSLPSAFSRNMGVIRV
jgi:chromosome segregation ATPase